jgi:hypothetical protein
VLGCPGWLPAVGSLFLLHPCHGDQITWLVWCMLGSGRYTYWKEEVTCSWAQ